MAHAPSSTGGEVGAGVHRLASWPPLALVVAGALGYALFLVLPFYVNHLERYPLAEVASGAHSDDLWPRGGVLGVVFGLGGLGTLAFGPLGAAIGTAWSAVCLWHKRGDHDVVGKTLLVLAAAVGAGTLVWLQSPFASALITWWLD